MVLKIKDTILPILLLLTGALIYIGFRSNTLFLNRWIDIIFNTETLNNFRNICKSLNMPQWIIYSLPDGLWITAYLLLINKIWSNHHALSYKVFIYIMPAFAIILEFLQFIGLCPGTYDHIDLICYIIPTLILTPLKYEF